MEVAFEMLKKWKFPSSYVGESYENYYCGLGRGRDSEILVESNFDCFLEALGGESDENGVIVTRASHWACGWVEQILIHEDAPAEILVKAEEMLAAIEDYPVLDEGDYTSKQSAAEEKDYVDFYHDELCKLWEKDMHNYILPAEFETWQMPKYVGEEGQLWTSSEGGRFTTKDDAIMYFVAGLDDEDIMECPVEEDIPTGMSAYFEAMDKLNMQWTEDGFPNLDLLYPVWRGIIYKEPASPIYQPPRTEY